MHQLLPKLKTYQNQPVPGWPGTKHELEVADLGAAPSKPKSARILLPLNKPWSTPRLLHNWQCMRSSNRGIRLVLIWSNFPQNTYNVYCPQQHFTAQIHYPCFVILAYVGRDLFLNLFCKNSISSASLFSYQPTVGYFFQKLYTLSFNVKITSLQHNLLKFPKGKNKR